MIATVFEGRGLFDLIAWCASTIAVWAQTHKAKAEDGVREVTDMVRRPVRWALRHPLRAIGRRLFR